MKQKVIFKSKANNKYLLDIHKKILMYIHPSIYRILDGNDTRGHESDIVGDARYYKQKLEFLKKYIFQIVRDKETNYMNLTSSISPDNVADNLINLRQVTFEVTDSCNLSCKYCGFGDFYNDYDKRQNRFLRYDLATILIDYLSILWMDKKYMHYKRNIFISFYGGEPLLGIDFIKKIIYYIEQKALPFKIIYSMTTNGILIEKYLDYLKEKDFNLLISLDGNETNNSYRKFCNGTPSFPPLFKTLKRLQRYHGSYFVKNVSFNSVLHDRNSISEIHRFIKDEFNKTPNIAELSASGIHPKMKNEFNSIFMKWLESLSQADNPREIIQDVGYQTPNNKRLMSMLAQYSGNIFQHYNDILISNSRKSFLPTGTCTPFSRKLFLTVNGKLLPCERIGHRFSLGQVSDSGVELDFGIIAEKYSSYYRNLLESCEDCYAQGNCLQCIFNMEDFVDYPNCSEKVTSAIFIRRLAENLSYLEDNPHIYEKVMKEWIID